MNMTFKKYFLGAIFISLFLFNTTFAIDDLVSIPNGVYIAAVKTDQYVYNEMLIIAR